MTNIYIGTDHQISKSRMPKLKNNGIYEVKCDHTECNGSYIGQTG